MDNVAGVTGIVGAVALCWAAFAVLTGRYSADAFRRWRLGMAWPFIGLLALGVCFYEGLMALLILIPRGDRIFVAVVLAAALSLATVFGVGRGLPRAVER